jgi:hypothetical protein
LPDRSADQEALGLASGDVSGEVTGAVDSSVEGNGAIDGAVLLLVFEQAPTASVAARMSRASNGLTMASSFRGTSQPYGALHAVDASCPRGDVAARYRTVGACNGRIGRGWVEPERPVSPPPTAEPLDAGRRTSSSPSASPRPASAVR